MKQKEDILKELQEVAPVLSTLDKVDLYQVSMDYFQSSVENIMEMAGKEETSGILSLLPRKELYTTPSSSFFESLADKIVGKINADKVAEELSYSAPHLLPLSRRQTLPVPAHYFASFPEVMVQMAAREQEAHHSEIGVLAHKWTLLWEQVLGFFSRPAYALAVAGCMGMVVCIGLVVNNNSLSEEDKIFAQMQQLSDSELHSYIGKHRDDFDERTILNHLDETDFTHYFDKPENVPVRLLRQTNSSSQDIITDEVVD